MNGMQQASHAPVFDREFETLLPTTSLERLHQGIVVGRIIHDKRDDLSSLFRGGEHEISDNYLPPSPNFSTVSQTAAAIFSPECSPMSSRKSIRHSSECGMHVSRNTAI